MAKYRVKAYLRSGESVTFISADLQEGDNPFPSLRYNEYLYFNYSQHTDIFDLLVHDWSWYTNMINDIKPHLINYTVQMLYQDVPEFIGLDRETAQQIAIEKGLSFRVVFVNGIQQVVEEGYNDSRVNVYLDNDVIYKAELY